MASTLCRATLTADGERGAVAACGTWCSTGSTGLQSAVVRCAAGPVGGLRGRLWHSVPTETCQPVKLSNSVDQKPASHTPA